MEKFFKHYILPISPEGSKLILNPKGVLSLFSEGNLVKQEVLSPLETLLITALLEAYPAHCTNEVLLSIQTGDSVEKCQQRILAALKEQTMHETTKSLRAMLALCRKKLHTFEVDIVTLHGVGCILEPLNHKTRAFKAPESITASKTES